MVLSMSFEYYGKCKEALDHYGRVFGGTRKVFRTYHDMPMAEMFGINGERLDLIYQSSLEVRLGKQALRLEMADSMLVAMQNQGYSEMKPLSPLFCIKSDDAQLKISLAAGLGTHQKERLDRPSSPRHEQRPATGQEDVYGLSWAFEGGMEGLFICFEFEGCCRQVIEYYQEAFGIKAESVVTYADSPFADQVKDASFIFESCLRFPNGDASYGVILYDSLESAKEGVNKYNPKDLLFYKNYNPILNLRNDDGQFLEQSFQRLSNGAKVNKPLEKGDDGIHGSIIDRHGICWNFYDQYGIGGAK